MMMKDETQCVNQLLELDFTFSDVTKDTIYLCYGCENFIIRVVSASALYYHPFDVALGKPLGSRGLEWLKIHLVNLTGLKKKSSNQERLQFADEVLPLAIQSASSPFEVQFML